MKSIEIAGATRCLGKPDDWDEATQGVCDQLQVRDEDTASGPIQTSAWWPSASERLSIIRGAYLNLHVWGTSHPPVALSVPEAPLVSLGIANKMAKEIASSDYVELLTEDSIEIDGAFTPSELFDILALHGSIDWPKDKTH